MRNDRATFLSIAILIFILLAGLCEASIIETSLAQEPDNDIAISDTEVSSSTCPTSTKDHSELADSDEHIQAAEQGVDKQVEDKPTISAPTSKITKNSCIKGIIFIGNKRTNNKTISSYIDIDQNKCLNNVDINQVIKKLYSTGFFSDVRSSVNDNDQLIITVKENPIVNSIIIRGANKIKAKSIYEILPLEKRSIFTKTKLRKATNKIKDLYKKHNYLFTNVKFDLRKYGDMIDIIFTIQENHKIKVADIRFTGNQSFVDQDLREIIYTKTYRIINIFSKRHIFDSDKLLLDREILRQFYLSNGFADFNVSSTIVEISNNHCIINFTLNEGRVFYINKVSIESKIQGLDIQELKELINVKESKKFDASKINESISIINNHLRRNYNSIEVNTDYKQHDNKIDIIFSIKENKDIYIDKVNISGNNRTRDEVIRRELRLADGDLYNEGKVIRSEQRLRALNFFESININKGISITGDDKIDLDVEVKDKPTGDIKLSAGYSSNSGFTTSIALNERNLFGTGRTVSMALQKTKRSLELDMKAADRYFLDKDLTASAGVYYRTLSNQDLSSYSSASTGFSVQASDDLTEYINYSLRYVHDNTQIKDVPMNASTLIKEQEGVNITSLIGYSMGFNSINSSLNPSSGHSISLSQNIAGIGGNAKYIKSEISGVYFNDKLFGKEEDAILRINSGIGYIWNYNTRSLRVNERFSLDSNSLRGFDDGGIGPRDLDTDDTLGGNFYYTGSAQINFPIDIIKKLNVRGSFFVDTGTLFGLDKDLQRDNITNDKNLRMAVGTGLVWLSPVGPIRINLAIPLLMSEGDKEKLISFNFGTVF